MSDIDDYEFDVWDDVSALIRHATLNDERSLQTEIGPSGLGTPCVRKLAHRLLNTPPVGEPDVPWRPTVGKAVHAWLEGVLQAANVAELASDQHSPRYGKCAAPWCDGVADAWSVNDDGKGHGHKLRYLTEFRVPVGTINGREIMGHVDVYDRARESIIDWKIAGPASLKRKHAHGMGDEYRVQQHVYARGCVKAGLPVENVGCCFLPMNGELRQGFVLAEPFDPAIAAEAFRRARVVENAVSTAGVKLAGVLGKLKTAPDYCSHCPWFSPGATDFATACPGDASLYEGLAADKSFEGL